MSDYQENEWYFYDCYVLSFEVLCLAKYLKLYAIVMGIKFHVDYGLSYDIIESNCKGDVENCLK